MAYEPGLHTASNKPYATIGGPDLGRYLFYDENAFVYRPYSSIGEVLSYLDTVASRQGKPVVLVDVSGVLTEYWFLYGTDDSDLIEKPYSLPIASASVLGGVKIGSGISVGSDGTISASSSQNLQQVTDAGNVTTKRISAADALNPTDLVTLQQLNTVSALLGNYIPSTQKGSANGIAPLDAASLIPSIYLPSYVDHVIEVSTYASLPAVGETGKIYVVTTAGSDPDGPFPANSQFRWTGTNYIRLVASPGTSDNVVEGITNLYFTQTRARQSISVSGNLTYNSSTGVIGYVTPSSVSNLALGTRTGTTIPITNSNGTGIVIPEATTTLGGLLVASDKVKINDMLTAGGTQNITGTKSFTTSFNATSATFSGNIIGSTAPTLGSHLTNKTYVDSKSKKLTKTVSATTYTLIVGDGDRWLVFTSATGCTVTIPNSVFSDGISIQGVQRGTAQVEFTAGSGVTLNKSSLVNLKTATINSVFGLQFESASTCTLFGELELV